MHADPPHEAPDPVRLAVDLSPTGTVVADALGRIVLVNRELERQFGYDRAELIGRPVELLIPERHRSIHPRHRARYDQLPEARRMGVGRELSGRRKDGSEFPVEIGLVPVEHEGQRFVIGTVVDITERRRLEEIVRQAQKLDAIGALAGGIAHDFNNVLSGILGYAITAREAVAEGSQVAADLDHVLAAAERGRTLVKSILAFSRRQDLKREPLDLRASFEEARGLLRATLPASVEIRASVRPGTPTVSADPSQIQQVLVNLATNGARAMAEHGGVLELEASPAHVDTTITRQHPALRPGPHARLAVRDGGTGMSPEVLERAFEPFFTTRSTGEGTGLGLAVVQNIVQEHGGAIGIESAPGEGTTVTVYLPAISSAPVVLTSSPGEAPRGLGECILYVEDELDLSRLWIRLLEGLGYRVEHHPNGSAALAAVRARPQDFDIVLTDHAMPGMSGSALAEEVRRLRPELPVVMMSGYREGAAAEALSRGLVRTLLAKPFSTREVAEALRDALA